MAWKHPQVLTAAPILAVLILVYAVALRRPPSRPAARYPASLLRGGVYHRAADAGRLRDVYRQLSRTMGWTVRPVDVSAATAAAAAALLATALVLGGRLHRLS